VPGRGIPYPSGDPNLSPAAEQQWRRELVQCALEALATAVEHPTIFEVSAADA
jgi:hypothetical protein